MGRVEVFCVILQSLKISLFLWNKSSFIWW